ncbi:hypothetical protein X291_04310 [Oenococcus oeni IOEB_C23]|uniref:DUF6625 family protein n=1 Tax=Oenococcus oeni TaxID=1247 RepID=UPI00050EB0B2|nr:DUF6625 family protein [Oenococcus oeni]KGH65878.1 hypothetical protein X291_04310 [Oenococcus oeni IOEB_C23]OIM54910.1 hypothetical protein ATX80_07160 [Oenococcus oeni]
MKNKVILIIPYFGQFPSLYEAWEKSALKQSDWIDFLILTDAHFIGRKNIKIINITFEDLKKNIESFFHENNLIQFPYDLVNFKPAYGEIFNKMIIGYNYWGYGDLDCVYGNLKSFVFPGVRKGYQKIGDFGHFTLFKNNKFMNSLYRLKTKNSPDFLTFVKKHSEKNHLKEYIAFDETAGIDIKTTDMGIDTYIPKNFCLDINPFKLPLFFKKSPIIYIKILETQIIAFFADGIVTEFGYVHYQKRNLILKLKQKVVYPFFITSTSIEYSEAKIRDNNFFPNLIERILFSWSIAKKSSKNRHGLPFLSLIIFVRNFKRYGI